MATVTGLTAARMLGIESSIVHDAQLVGGDLILIRKDGSQVNVGSVTGPQGPAGPSGADGADGDVSAAMMNSAIAAAVTQLKTETGRGIVADDTVIADQTGIAFKDNQWVTVSNLSVTFTPVGGRMYQFGLHSSARVLGASGIPVDFRVVRTGGEEILRVETYCAIAGLGSGFTANRILEAPGTWTGTQTFVVHIRPHTNNEVIIPSATVPSSLTVIDQGLAP